MPVTQKQIADLLGVSRSTVSKALSGDVNVAEGVRTKVMEACARLGYSPNYHARSLITGRTETVAMLAKYVRMGELHSEWTSLIHQAVVKAGYRFRLEINPLRSIVAERSADAMIAFGQHTYRDAGVLSHHRERRDPPIIFVDCGENDFEYDSVTTDNHGGSAEAVSHLVGLGHRRIGFVGLIDAYSVTKDRYMGYLHRMNDLGLPAEGGFTVKGDDWPTELDQVLALGPRIMRMVDQGVTAFIATSDLEALGILHILHANGLRAPGDVSLIGHSDSVSSRLSIPLLTTVRQDLEGAAMAAVRMALDAMATGLPQPNERVPTQLIVRGSTGPPPLVSTGAGA